MKHKRVKELTTILTKMRRDYEKSLLNNTYEGICNWDTEHGMCNWLLKNGYVSKAKRDEILAFLWIFAQTVSKHTESYWFPTVESGHSIGSSLQPRLDTINKALELLEWTRKRNFYVKIVLYCIAVSAIAATLFIWYTLK